MAPRVAALSVLYHTDAPARDRALAALARAAELACGSGACSGVDVILGDSSPAPTLDMAQLSALRARHGAVLTLDYVFFNANLGSAGGWNRLATGCGADFLLLINPDVVVSPRALEIMLGDMRRPEVGLVEARQLPIEHPKDYDVATGTTGWAAMVCALARAELFHRLGGFDHESFFLHYDDVDLSWRVRLAGYDIVYQPAAAAFHDKRLNDKGRVDSSETELDQSAQAVLILTHKWSRPDLNARILADFAAHEEPRYRRAAEIFMQRRAEGRLPAPLDPDHRIAEFLDGLFTRHRYPL